MYVLVSELRGACPVRQYCRIARRAGVQEGWYPDSAGAEYRWHRGLVAMLTAGKTGQASTSVLLLPRVLLVLCSLLIFLPPLSFSSSLLYLASTFSSFWRRVSVLRTGLTIRGSKLGRGRRFCSLPYGRDRLWSPPGFPLRWVPVFYPGNKAFGALRWPLISIRLRLRMSGAVPSLMCLWRGWGQLYLLCLFR